MQRRSSAQTARAAIIPGKVSTKADARLIGHQDACRNKDRPAEIALVSSRHVARMGHYFASAWLLSKIVRRCRA